MVGLTVRRMAKKPYYVEHPMLTIAEPQLELLTEKLTLCQASHRVSD